jgi:CBS-domain-containing membrane protein
MFEDVITAFPEETEEDVAADISKYDLIAMPVVDEHGQMLGIVTVDDAMEVIEDSAEEGDNKRTWLAVIITALCFVIFLVPYTAIIIQFFGGSVG